MLKKIKLDRFVIAIIISIVIAYFFPFFGTKVSPIDLNQVSSIGISLIFFFYGLSLDNEAIKNGLRNWKLHVSVQSCTFVLFPLLVMLFYPLVKDSSYQLLWLSFLFMAALPSTVSSSVVMVSMARGNLPAAIFNASISGILGIVFTPLWLMPFAQKSNIEFDFTAIYMQLLTEIVIPLALGLLLRRFLAKYAHKYKRETNLFDKFIILLIIYKSFVHSFEDQIFTRMKWSEMTVMVILVIILFFVMYTLTGRISRWLGFSHKDRITNQYCGTKKSLVHGAVFSEALFGTTNIVGILILPLMFYHAFQILIISIFATEEGKKQRELENKTE